MMFLLIKSSDVEKLSAGSPRYGFRVILRKIRSSISIVTFAASPRSIPKNVTIEPYAAIAMALGNVVGGELTITLSMPSGIIDFTASTGFSISESMMISTPSWAAIVSRARPRFEENLVLNESDHTRELLHHMKFDIRGTSQRCDLSIGNT